MAKYTVAQVGCGFRGHRIGPPLADLPDEPVIARLRRELPDA